MWIKDNVFEYKIPSQPTRKHFKEIVNIIVENKDYEEWMLLNTVE